MQRKVPLPGRIFARCILRRRFAGHFGCMARISCQSQLILDTRRRYAATNWRFSRPRPLSGCMERKTCHGLPPVNAFREYFAIGKRPGTHRGGILSRQGTRERTARVYCHCQSGQERIRAQSRHRWTPGERISRAFCHRRAPGNVSRHNLATTGCPRRTPRAPMCHGSRSAHALWLRTPPVVYATRHPDAAELRVLQAVRALAVTQPADCRVAAERVVNIAKLVSVPQRRSARHHASQRHNAMLHNAPRCNTMMPCAVRGAFVAAEKVSCGLRVSMR